MPRIKRELYKRSETYQQAMEQSRAAGERADCAVRAVLIAANALGLPHTYAEVRDLFIQEGRKPGCGTYGTTTAAVLKRIGLAVAQEWDLGFYRNNCNLYATAQAVAHFTSRYPKGHRKLRSVTTHHMDRFPQVWQDGCVYLLSTDQHIATVVDGVLHDHNRGRACRVKRIRKLIKAQP